MKKIRYTLLLVFLGSLWYRACDACKLQQPKVTQELTHGTGPGSYWDWVIVALIAVITLITLFYSVKYLIKPGEKSSKNIKNTILDF